MILEVIKTIGLFLIAPGLLVTAAVGLFSTWIDRKVTARLQYRIGPPWFQPFADVLKLMGKETIVPEGGARMVFIFAPIVGLAAVTLVSTILWLLNLDRVGSFVGDLIVVIYLLTVPSIALIVGGSASRNPLAALGASREMKLILAYELPFLLAIFTIIAKTGSILFSNILSYQSTHGMLAASLSGVLALGVSILVMQAKLGYVPFDMPEAEQELMGGPIVEYSGVLLGIFKVTKAMLLFTLPVFLITLFLGGIDILTIAGAGWFALKYVLLLVVIILIKNTNPRLRIDQAVRFFWGPVTVIATLALILAMIGW